MTVRLLDYWSPPDGAGAAVGCLATTFAFETDFFEQDCLARFLRLSTVTSEGDAISSVAALLEEEERLGEAQVTVLVDRGTPAEKRNLRWDLLSVTAPGGLLHAKVAVLLWEHAARLLIGSSNLTSAGYRRQVEVALAVDLDDQCQLPRPFVDEVVAELRRIVDLVPGPALGAKARAFATLDRFVARLDSLDLPSGPSRELRLAVAPSRPGVSPLERRSAVWRGPQPLRATVLSPFWDDDPEAVAIDAIRDCVTGRPQDRRHTTLVVAVDPVTAIVQAPRRVGSIDGVDVLAFDPPDDEPRLLHAKVILLESDEWIATMIGSSNATKSGLGRRGQRGHHELNVWLGCSTKSPIARRLRGLIPLGEPVSMEGDFRQEVDEDELTTPALPAGFVTCTIRAGGAPSALLSLAPEALPPSWEVLAPTGEAVTTAEEWDAEGRQEAHAVALPNKLLPAYLLVRWQQDGEEAQATWTANVEDRGTLPPPSELAGLSVDVILAALASSRPLPVALEHELRRRLRDGHERTLDLDPLRRFDDSGLLMQRARHVSIALWRLQERLARPATSIDALTWRLHGAIGPIAIADGITRKALAGETIAGEAEFLLAELALTIANVEWRLVAPGIEWTNVRRLLSAVVAEIDRRRLSLPSVSDASLAAYINEAFEKARP